MSSKTKSDVARPKLPTGTNPHLKILSRDGPQPVKFQIIVREGQEIIVGRIKIPTPESHAFILRRFDTGAISLSTMFRSSFPHASEEQERQESSWVKANYDTQGANGGGKLRLAGTWVPPTVAMHLAKEYHLENIVDPLVHAVPESASAYRKSNQKAPSATTLATTNSAASVGTVSQPTPTTPRSPRPQNRQQAAPSPTTSPPSTTSVKETSPSPKGPPAKRSRKSASPAPATITTRSSTRTTPAKTSSSPLKVQPTPKPPVIREEETEPEVPGPDPDQDIAEAKAEVAALKAQRDAALSVPTTPAANKKRTIEHTETPPLKFDMERIAEVASQAENGIVVERPIKEISPGRLARITNVQLKPAHKAAAWGSLAFMVGVAATTYLPQFLW
ncbi:hypothetical protein FRC02_000062 [Tulasnella sp. 418]|nr:hypothetical protein FRC02_000062 [Tulasnella sp. 418]